MNIKEVIYRLRQDAKRLTTYPKATVPEGGELRYDLYWEERDRGQAPKLSDWQKERTDLILSMIEPGSTVLDIGCGDGAILLYMKEQKSLRTIGVDVDPGILELAAERGIETMVADLNDLASIEALPEVDYVIAFEIIEHLPTPERLLLALSKKVRKGMCVSIPNSGYYLYRLRLLFGRMPAQWIVHPGEHVRFWTVKDMRWWVKALGMRLRRLFLYKGIPGLNHLCPSWFGAGMVVVIEPEPASFSTPSL